MKSHRLLPLGFLMLAAISLCVAAPARAAEGHFDRTLQVTGPVDLNVDTGSGSITVRAGESSTVRVTGAIRASGGWSDNTGADQRIHRLEANPPIEQHGNVIKIGHMEDEELQRNISISYDIIVPVETRLRSNTGSGEQNVSGLHGPVEVSSGSGSITLSKIGDTVRVTAGSGRISLDDVKGRVHASTGSGEIHATGVAGGLHASTGSGSVTLLETAPGDVDVSTGSGSLRLEGVHGALHASTASGNILVEGEGEGSWRLSTASGNVTVRLPSQQGYTLHAHTVSGSIHTAREMTVQGTVGPHELEGKVGNGGLPLDVSTVSGNIRVE